MQVSGLVMMVMVVVQVEVYPLVERCGLSELAAAAAVAGLVLGWVGAGCDQAVGGIVHIPLAVVCEPGLQGRAAGGSQQCSPALLCNQAHAGQHSRQAGGSQQCLPALLCIVGHARQRIRQACML